MERDFDLGRPETGMERMSSSRIFYSKTRAEASQSTHTYARQREHSKSSLQLFESQSVSARKQPED